MNTLSSIGTNFWSGLGQARGEYFRYLGIAVLMVLVSALAFAMRYNRPIASDAPRLNLESIVPQTFSNWKIDPNTLPIQLSPELRALVEKAYDQTLSRTYIDERGDRVMLSIAYGGNRQEEMQAHRPESCYPAQGFIIAAERAANLLTSYGELPIKRLLAVQGNRSEPITYWLVIGGKPARFGLEHRLATLRFALTGHIPDGMLVRVSTISKDMDSAYQVQDKFLNDMLAAMSTENRTRLIGQTGT